MTGNDINGNLTILSDPLMRTWKLPARLNAINGAMRQIAADKPKASTKLQPLQLLTGVTRQSVPAGVVQVLDLLVNLGTDGATVGRPISAVALDRLQASQPTWRRDKGAAVRHLVQDDRDPGTFTVWPAPTAAVWVEALVHTVPTAITALADTLPLGDSYLNAAIEYVLHMLYAQEAENDEYAGLSAAHYSKYQQTLGIQVQRQKKASSTANSAENPTYPVVDKNGA